MEGRYHRQMLTQMLAPLLGPQALQVVIAANLQQDNLRGQIEHPEYHFDNDQLGASQAYIEAQRQLARAALLAGDCRAGWQAYGRLSHAAQDFYAHSNYVRLWVSRYPPESLPPPDQIDPLDPQLLNHPSLGSSRTYLPWEALSFVPPLEPLMRRLLPRDSHTWLNLDGPRSGPLFAYALSAASRRTLVEYQLTVQGLEQAPCLTL